MEILSHSSPWELVRSRLSGWVDIGRDQAKACCPAHDDAHPSLALRECDDGTVLLHCYAGCSALEVVRSMGLEFRDLFRGRSVGRVTNLKRARLPAEDALRCIDHEALTVVVIASDVLDHRQIDLPTLRRLALASARIGQARDACAPASGRR
jgi:hypothetical protein